MLVVTRIARHSCSLYLLPMLVLGFFCGTVGIGLKYRHRSCTALTAQASASFRRRHAMVSEDMVWKPLSRKLFLGAGTGTGTGAGIGTWTGFRETTGAEADVGATSRERLEI